MNYEAARLYVELAIFLVSAGAWVYIVYARRQSADRADFEDLCRLVTRHDEQLKNTPTQADVTDLRVGLAEVRGEIKALAAEVHGIRDLLPPLQHSINLMNDWMRNNK